jgi:nitrite reductase/ring-hydroxylating ferredoxin subunit
MDETPARSITIDTSDLPANSIRAISQSVCVVRTESGVYAFERVCPHAGADLANGYVEAGKVRCTWHNLPYDPVDGSQPCRSLHNLRTFPLTQLGPQTYRLDS